MREAAGVCRPGGKTQKPQLSSFMANKQHKNHVSMKFWYFWGCGKKYSGLLRMLWQQWRGEKLWKKNLILMKSTRVHRGEKKFGEHKKKLIAFLVAFFCYSFGVLWVFSSVIVVDSFSLSALRRRGPTKKRIKIIKRTAKSVYKKYNRLVLRLLQLFMCYVFDYRSWFLCFCRCCCSSLRRWLITMQKLSMKTDSLLVVFIVDWQY